MLKKLRGSRVAPKVATPTKSNPQEDEGEHHHLYNNHHNGSQESPQSAASNQTNPNQGSPRTSRKRSKTPPTVEAPGSSPASSKGGISPNFSKFLGEGKQLFKEGKQLFLSFLDDACASTPCSSGTATVDDPIPLKRMEEFPRKEESSAPTLGISRMAPPDKGSESNLLGGNDSDENAMTDKGVEGGSASVGSGSAGAEIEVSSKNHVKVTEKSPSRPPRDPRDTMNGSRTPNKKKAPLDLLEVTSAEASELERSISELTMRSSYGGVEHLHRLPDNRRMAYYAVGKHHRQSGRGGNRRCYFSGKLILGGAPFYAGTVQQGLRTLVVFCLPSAVGLPDQDTVAMLKRQQKQRKTTPNSPLHVHKQQSGSTAGGISYSMRDPASRLGKNSSRGRRSSGMSSIADGSSIGSKSMSRLSSLDDLSLSIDGDLDPNWGLDRDLLVQVLPEADADLLKQMSDLFPEQFATLPVQVRAPARWNLYVKFCFFSGLPIAEGEMHYKVKEDIADAVYGEELALSHEVLEAVNGEQSADILQLPNQKVFKYLRKHYAQQCSKLDDRVFRRTAWEKIAPEV